MRACVRACMLSSSSLRLPAQDVVKRQQSHLCAYLWATISRQLMFMEAKHPLFLQKNFNIVFDDARAHPQSTFVVLLDEANTSPDQGDLKQILCDGMLLGHQVPGNVYFILVMNPYRMRDHNFDTLETGGLECDEYFKDHSKDLIGRRTPFKGLVYQVYPVPETMLTLVWDYGNPSGAHCNIHLYSVNC